MECAQTCLLYNRLITQSLLTECILAVPFGVDVQTHACRWNWSHCLINSQSGIPVKQTASYRWPSSGLLRRVFSQKFTDVSELRWFIALMMESEGTSDTSVNFYQTTGRNNPEDSHLYTHRLENLKSDTHSNLWKQILSSVCFFLICMIQQIFFIIYIWLTFGIQKKRQVIIYLLFSYLCIILSTVSKFFRSLHASFTTSVMATDQGYMLTLFG
jgi:hypothetical protein